MAAKKMPSSDDDPGYEVVENPADPGYEVVENPPPPKAKSAAKLPTAKLLPPLPPAKSNPPRPAPKATVKPVVEEEPGFEVVTTGPPAKPKSKAAIVVDDDEEDVLPETKQSKRVVDDTEEDERPRKKSRRPVAEVDEDEDDDDRPSKKRGKKGKKGAKGIDDETNNKLMEWAAPVFLMVAGLAMTCLGTYGIAKHPDYGISPGLAVMIAVIGEFISIPITIVALIFIGSLFGIEYGSIFSAIRNLAAMGFLTGGLVDVFEWGGLPDMIYMPIIFLINVGLFMTLFGLDVFETMVTVFMLNVLSWLMSIAMLFILVALLMSAEKKRERMGNDPDDGPSLKQKDRNDRPGGKNRFNDPDDGFDPDDNE